MDKTLRFATLFSLCITGCATLTTPSAVPATLPMAEVAPPFRATTGSPDQPLRIAVAPVQLDSENGLVTNIFGDALPQALGEWALVVAHDWGTFEPDETPQLVEAKNRFSTYNVFFDRTTLPQGPYGTFWVGIANPSDHAVTITPKQIALVANGKAYPVLADAGSIYGRYDLTLKAARHRWNEGTAARFDNTVYEWTQYLVGTMTLPPHTRWTGYVAFDVGAYTADEYNAFLGRAKTMSIDIREDGKDVALAFTTTHALLPVVCMPDSKVSFERCERRN